MQLQPALLLGQLNAFRLQAAREVCLLAPSSDILLMVDHTWAGMARIARWQISHTALSRPVCQWAACRPEQSAWLISTSSLTSAFFSGGSIAPTNITDIAAFKQNVKLVFVSYGSRELDPANRRGGGRGPFGGDPQANTEALKQAGVNTHFYISPQTAHEWQSWRRSLYQFAPLLFLD